MPMCNVVLTEQQEEVIEALVSSGRYQNANEVLREGLHLLERREEKHAAKLAAAAAGFEATDGDEFPGAPEENLSKHNAALERRLTSVFVSPPAQALS